MKMLEFSFINSRPGQYLHSNTF